MHVIGFISQRLVLKHHAATNVSLIFCKLALTAKKINTTKLSPSATDRNCILSAHGVQVKVGSASLQRVSWKGQQGRGAVSNTVPDHRHPLSGEVDPTCHLWGLRPSPCRVGLRHWGVQSQRSSCHRGR